MVTHHHLLELLGLEGVLVSDEEALLLVSSLPVVDVLVVLGEHGPRQAQRRRLQVRLVVVRAVTGLRLLCFLQVLQYRCTVNSSPIQSATIFFYYNYRTWHISCVTGDSTRIHETDQHQTKERTPRLKSNSFWITQSVIPFVIWTHNTLYNSKRRGDSFNHWANRTVNMRIYFFR